MSVTTRWTYCHSFCKQKVKPDIVVILTDGDTPWPSAEEVRRSKVTIVTAIVHEYGTNGCPEYMNPIHVDCG